MPSAVFLNPEEPTGQSGSTLTRVLGLLGTSCPESYKGAFPVPIQIRPKISECGPPLQQGQHAPIHPAEHGEDPLRH